MTAVLDASGMLAFLHDEPGADPVRAALAGALIVQKSLQRQVDIAGMREELAETGVGFVPFTAEQAEVAARLWTQTHSRGLSLADRACLALALERGVPVLTADRVWAELGLALDIRLIR